MSSGDRQVLKYLKPTLAGLLTSLSVAPFGFWILGPLGIALLYRQLYNKTARQRLLVGFLFALGYFAISYLWVTSLVAAGYVVLVIFEALLTGIGTCLTKPPNLVRFAGVLTLVDAFRWTWPFGGMPMGSLALGQAASPLGQLGRLGGPLLVEFVTILIGAAIGEATVRNHRPVGRYFVFGVLVVLVAVLVAPDGGARVGTIRVAVVQGGGPRGLHAVFVNPALVTNRELVLTEKLKRSEHINLVLWPEDVISLSEPLALSQIDQVMGNLARRLNSTLEAGVTITTGSSQFYNQAVAWGPTGQVVGTYEKVHRVPFGEYVPDRSFFSHLGPTSLVPRDAIAGHGPAIFQPTTTARKNPEIFSLTRKLGVVISFEVLFPGRARSGITSGAQVLTVPTNDASYRSGQVPAQEVAADQLRAIEEGRDLVQAAPTGYSDLVSNRGAVIQRTPLGAARVLIVSVPLREGRTIYSYLGDLPWVALLAIVALI